MMPSILLAKDGKWTATGAQFAHPYVFKKLFSREDITMVDLCETAGFEGAIYLDFDFVQKPMFDYKGRAISPGAYR